MVVATAIGLVALRFLALGAMAMARRAPRPPTVETRLALANLHRPGAPTPSVVISLGLGLAVIVALALVDVNMRDQLHPLADGATPNFYFLDVRNADAEPFRQFLQQEAPGAKVRRGADDARPHREDRRRRGGRLPCKRKRAVGAGGRSRRDLRRSAAARVRGCEGRVVARDYSGPPLVSIESEVADGLGLKVGDDITVNVLGRNVTAKIANLRKVNWRTFAINFVLVYSPSAFRGAPYSMLVSATLDGKSGANDELTLMKATTKNFPTVSAIRVREALDAIEALVAKLNTAIRWAASVALATSALTLAGALAANRRARIADAVILKVLGATRRRLMAIFLMEYVALGAATAIFGVGAGALAAYVIVSRVMGFEFDFSWGLLARLCARRPCADRRARHGERLAHPRHGPRRRRCAKDRAKSCLGPELTMAAGNS